MEKTKDLKLKIEQARQRLADSLKDCPKAVLQFSGGKDSLACLYLARPWWDSLTVLWGNAGDPYPETVELMRSVRAMVPHFHELRGNAASMQIEHGYPVDMLPLGSTWIGRKIDPDTNHPKLIGRFDCCRENWWMPLQSLIDGEGVRCVIRGQRNAERLRNGDCNHGTLIPGSNAQIVLPMFDWADSDVFDYLEAEGVTIPRQYAFGLKSLDCLHCTAWMLEGERKIEYLQAYHPEAAIEVMRRLQIIDIAQEVERGLIKRAISTTNKRTLDSANA